MPRLKQIVTMISTASTKENLHIMSRSNALSILISLAVLFFFLYLFICRFFVFKQGWACISLEYYDHIINTRLWFKLELWLW
ncbi:unnamed protein product [Brassica rapa subsp. trilocularis]